MDPGNSRTSVGAEFEMPPLWFIVPIRLRLGVHSCLRIFISKADKLLEQCRVFWIIADCNVFLAYLSSTKVTELRVEAPNTKDTS